MSSNNAGKRIRSIAPSITQSDIDLVTQAVTHGWFDNMSMHVDQFVAEFRAFCNKTYCLPVSHGTAAIQLALEAIGVQPGDEVIVPDITWVASASPILHIGATPVLVDVQPDTWCICPQSFEAAISEKTKAVICVDLFGSVADYQAIIPIARQRNIVVIEDAAEGIGSTYQGKPAGSLGDIGVYSFNATKLIMGGQGGMLVTENEAWYKRAKRLAHHGIDMELSGKYYWSNELGYNYNWSNINAALALSQLRRINELVSFKRQVFDWYYSHLAEVPEIQLNAQPDQVYNCYWITCAVIDPKLNLTKEYIKAWFEQYNIDVRPFFYPLSEMPPFSPEHAKGHKQNKVSQKLSKSAICLPSGYDLTSDDVDRVCRLFIKLINETKAAK